MLPTEPPPPPPVKPSACTRLMAFNSGFTLLFGFSSECIKCSHRLVCSIDALPPLRLLRELYFLSVNHWTTANWLNAMISFFRYVNGNNYFILHLFEGKTKRPQLCLLFPLPAPSLPRDGL